MATLNGIDISAYQSGINISKLTSTDFIVVKATEGISYTNQYMTNHANAVLTAGKPLGFYHYANGGNTAAAEAQHFVDAVKPYIGKAILCLDWEESSIVSKESWALEWLQTVKKLTGVTPLFYCYQSALSTYKYSSIAKAGFKLWLAQYANMSTTDYKSSPWQSGSIGAFSSYVMHQYSSKGRITGYSADLDLDKFYGGVSDWKALASKSTGDDTVSYYIANAANTASGCKIQQWYNFNCNVILRPYSVTVAEDLAMAMELGCKNDNILYNQSKRTTLYTAMAALGFKPENMSKVSYTVYTDCSAMVGVGCNCAGLSVSKDIWTGNEKAALLATGAFYEVTGKALTDPSYLLRGDVLLNESEHTAVAMDNGKNAAARLTKSGSSAASSTVDYSPSVAKGMQSWKNSTGGTLTVYSESYQATAIGSLDDGDTGYCFGKVWDSEANNGSGCWMWSVAYHPTSHPKGWKEGYVTDSGGSTF